MALGRKTGGRVKGTPNKITKSVRESLELAFRGMGGTRKLMEWGKENPTEFYRIWSKLLPTQLTGEGGGPITFANLTDDELDSQIEATKRAITEALERESAAKPAPVSDN